MNRKISSNNIHLTFTKEWEQCECGCGKEFKHALMWRRTYARKPGWIPINQYFSIFHMTKNRIASMNRPYKQEMREVPMSELTPCLHIYDYEKLPYNLHIFTINVDSYDGHHCFYVYRIQEIPGCQASSENMQEARQKLQHALNLKIREYYDNNELPPLPETYNPDFVSWNQENKELVDLADLAVHTKASTALQATFE